jgi:hypothetical protein
MVLVAPQDAVATALRTAKLDALMPVAADVVAARAVLGVQDPGA